jgi:hypothetical protein
MGVFQSWREQCTNCHWLWGQMKGLESERLTPPPLLALHLLDVVLACHLSSPPQNYPWTRSLSPASLLADKSRGRVFASAQQIIVLFLVKSAFCPTFRNQSTLSGVKFYDFHIYKF